MIILAAKLQQMLVLGIRSVVLDLVDVDDSPLRENYVFAEAQIIRTQKIDLRSTAGEICLQAVGKCAAIKRRSGARVTEPCLIEKSFVEGVGQVEANLLRAPSHIDKVAGRAGRASEELFVGKDSLLEDVAAEQAVFLG